MLMIVYLNNRSEEKKKTAEADHRCFIDAHEEKKRGERASCFFPFNLFLPLPTN